MRVSNIDQLKREALADRVTWDFKSETLPVREPPSNMKAFEVRCRICSAHSASGHACTHGARA